MSIPSTKWDPGKRLAFLQGEVRRLGKCNRYEDIVANMALGILEVDTQRESFGRMHISCSVSGILNPI